MMQATLERMRQVLAKADELYTESQTLGLAGDLHGSFRKQKAADFAMETWETLNQQYRAAWLRQRRRFQSCHTNTLTSSSFISLCLTHHRHVLFSLFILPSLLPMTNATAPSPAFSKIFQNQKPQQSTLPKPATQKQEPPAPAPSKKKEAKKYWGYVSVKGKVFVLRYVSDADAPPDNDKLAATEELYPKDFTRMTTKSFKKWQDDAYDIVNASTGEFEAKNYTEARATAERLLAKALATFRAEKSKKNETK